MSGVGKFKLTDALPKNMPEDLDDATGAGHQSGGGKGKAKAKSKKATTGKTKGTHELTAEQAREARESSRAKNAEASVRGHMVDIGRGNQQAGRQKAK
ncbi:MAG: hypothetical protein ACP5XB_03720 [Isosphaeraceae bacterium]